MTAKFDSRPSDPGYDNNSINRQLAATIGPPAPTKTAPEGAAID